MHCFVGVGDIRLALVCCSSITLLILLAGLLQRIAFKACELLDQGVAHSARDVDVLGVMAMGFLPNYGGLMAYADTAGPSHIVQRLKVLQEKLPYIAISPYLERMAEKERASQNTGDARSKGHLFRPDIGTASGVPKGACGVRTWAPASLGLADALVVAGLAAASAAIVRLSAKL